MRLILKLLLVVNLVKAEPLIDTFNDVEETFMDSVYGDLVSTEDSRLYKQSLLRENSVLYPQNDKVHDLRDDWENLIIDQLSDLNNYAGFHSQLVDSAKEFNALVSHKSYRKLKKKLHYPDDDDVSDIQDSGIFGGILTFAHFNHFNCFDKSNLDDKNIDIAIVGAPFDTGVSYRPGARFGPEAIRSTSRRLGLGRTPVRGNGKPDSKLGRIDPYNTTFNIIDCGDIAMTPFDNRIALNQLYRGQRAIHSHNSENNFDRKPKIITMGGDHTVTLMALRSSFEQYGKLTVLHFDSHIDTWDPKILGGGITSYMSLNHGTFLHYAAENGYLNTSSCMHLGLRAPYIAADYDIDHDSRCGFKTLTARDLDNYGKDEIIRQIKQRVGNNPVYISVDIDVLDPATAPGTGTMEVGGWTSRELISILDGLEGIHLIGADVVEVSPPFDTNSEITSLAATAVIDSFLGLMLVEELD